MSVKAGQNSAPVDASQNDDTSRDRQVDLLTDYQPRPGYGTAGRETTVYANMFEASLKGGGKQAKTVYHYDVDINPVVKVANQKKPKALLEKIFKQLETEGIGEQRQRALLAGAFDSVKNFWTPFKICEDDEAFEHVLALNENDGEEATDDRRRFKVVITFAAIVDLESLPAFCQRKAQSALSMDMMLSSIQAVNVLLRQDPGDRYRLVGSQGRKFMDHDGATSIADGAVVLNGFIQSFRFTESGNPALQLDTAYSVFIQPGMLPDVVAALLGRASGAGAFGRGGGRGGRGGGRGHRGGSGGGPPRLISIQGAGQDLRYLDPREIRKLNGILRNEKFQPTHRPTKREFSIQSISNVPASKLSFNLLGRDGRPDRQISVVDYYREQYNMHIRNPDLPCVIFGTRNYIPLELVRILPFNSIPMRKLTSDQTADMIKVAAKPPFERKDRILQWRRKLDYESLPKLKDWGLTISANMMDVRARILPPPQVIYRNSVSRVLDGGWNLRGGVNKFLASGRPLQSWAAVSFDRNVDARILMNFISALVRNLRSNGVIVDQPQPLCLQVNPDAQGPDGKYANIKTGLREAAIGAFKQSRKDPQLIIVIEPRKDTILKTEVKKVAAEGLKAPVVTQVLVGTNLTRDKGLDQYINNVTMKIALKLGGATHSVNLSPEMDSKTMLIGADVSHPPPGRGVIQPSIAVSVAATDGKNLTFKPCIRLQEGRQEMIENLEEMVTTHLKLFESNSRTKPDKIVFYRDGVSEGQYAQCVDIEFPRIRAAARSFGHGYNPKITFIICAKRHRMRFFAKESPNRDGGYKDTDRTGNLVPGLVVDRGVTHPFAFDFYLQAHAGLQGTAKPTHYVVMKDENGFTADKLQGLTYKLCHTFARATRSVSLVPVAYYADIIAGRARDIAYSDDLDETSTSTSSGTRAEFNPLRFKERFEDHPTFGHVAWASLFS